VPQNFTPTPADYAKDLAQSLATHKANSFLLPEYALQFMGLTVRRALYAEALLLQEAACTSIRSVHALLEQSLLPEFNQPDTIAPQQNDSPASE
jgi:hypothetical protein